MKRFWLSILTGSAVALTGLVGCAASPLQSVESSDIETVVEAEADQIATALPKRSTNRSGSLTNDEAAQRPQLIKKASLSLRVNSIEDSIKQIREITREQEGDILSLTNRSNRKGTDSESYRSSRLRSQSTFLELRVPQSRFDSAVDALAEIGDIEDRSIETEDVSSQLVDLQARISNSQQSEVALKEIMSRSGEIADVLEVSRELSRVRQEIEQMKAAQKSLQTQVRYSTVSVSLESAIAQSYNQPAFTTQLANTWRASTASVGNFTTDLIQVGLWLLLYSPYIAILLCGIAGARKFLRRSASD